MRFLGTVATAALSCGISGRCALASASLRGSECQPAGDSLRCEIRWGVTVQQLGCAQVLAALSVRGQQRVGGLGGGEAGAERFPQPCDRADPSAAPGRPVVSADGVGVDVVKGPADCPAAQTTAGSANLAPIACWVR